MGSSVKATCKATESVNRLEETVPCTSLLYFSHLKSKSSLKALPFSPCRNPRPVSAATREMEIITAPPIPLCTFYCQFSNRKTAAVEKKEEHKLYRALPPAPRPVSPLPASILPPSLSFLSSLCPPLDGQFLFPFPLRRHSRVNSSSSSSESDQLSPAGHKSCAKQEQPTHIGEEENAFETDGRRSLPLPLHFTSVKVRCPLN